jgi:hypothetical protein
MATIKQTDKLNRLFFELVEIGKSIKQLQMGYDKKLKQIHKQQNKINKE